MKTETLPIVRFMRALASDCDNTDGWEDGAADVRRAADIIEELVGAGQGIIDRMADNLANGKGVEADDGEKCFIVHSDDIEGLRRVIAKVRQ